MKYKLTTTVAAIALFFTAAPIHLNWANPGARAVERTECNEGTIRAAIAAAQAARRRLDYSEALRLLNEATKPEAPCPSLLVEKGELFLASEQTGRARRCFEEALLLQPIHWRALTGMAAVELLERNHSAAESRIRSLLASESTAVSQPPDTDKARTLALLSRLLVDSNRIGEAAAEAERAFKLDPKSGEAAYVLAYVKSSERKSGEARAYARIAVQLDPFNAAARRMLSQYLNGQSGLAQQIPEPGRRAYKRGQVLKAEGRLKDAARHLNSALAIEPRYYRALLSLGDILLRQEDYSGAVSVAERAVAIDQDGALAHLQLSYAHLGLQERARLEIGGLDFCRDYYKQTGPRPAGGLIDRVFPDYGALNKHQQLVIDLAVAPLSGYLPSLAQKGARHYLLQYDQCAVDIGELRRLANSVTFDGRYYASLRGFGGKSTVSGVEYIETAARAGFNTIAHEFAHQVHTNAMGPADTKIIRELYERALRESRVLDYYAAANEFEYFAQGYEAFVSYQKRPGVAATGKHTRRDLLERDPELYKLLVKLDGKTRRAKTATPLGSHRLLQRLPALHLYSFNTVSLTTNGSACEYQGRFSADAKQLSVRFARPIIAPVLQ